MYVLCYLKEFHNDNLKNVFFWLILSHWPQWKFGIFGINTPGEMNEEDGNV